MGSPDRWVAVRADDELRRSFPEPDLDERGWEPVDVPGHWQSTPAFAGEDGPVFYRARFGQRAGPGDRRWWLRFDGIFYQGDVWLDGTYLGDTEGYFAPHEFEVTDALRSRQEHTLAVEVTCSPQADRAHKRNITGVFQDWECFDPAWNPGGIWRPVRLVDTGPVRIVRLITRCTEASQDRAVLAFVAQLDAAEGVDAHVRTTVGPVDHGVDHTLASGHNTVEWSVTVDRPELWWPHALGAAHLEPVTVEIRLRDAAGSAVSDRRRFRTGLRSVQLRGSAVEVNGERLFTKGSNVGPTRMALGEATPAECRRDVELARDAGLDLLRVHGHVARPETYDAADRAGMLLWQDFPLQRGYARQIRWQATRQAADMVALVGHHPSIAVWCAHNEPVRAERDLGDVTGPGRRVRRNLRRLASHQLPTWNKTVLDRSVKRAIERTDGTRPAVAHSGVLPHLPRLRGTDSHLYLGWYRGSERQLPAFAKLLPSQVRFPTEFGAQAVPDTDDFMDPESWPDLDWDRLEESHSLQRTVLDRFVPRDGHSYESWKNATQRYQATVVRHHIETLRRLKYRPTGGFAQFFFADGHPGVTWSVLDHERRPKLAHRALVAACRPVIAVADRMPDELEPGAAVALDVHVVSDRRLPLSGRMEVTLSWDGGGHRWSFEGDVPADSCVRVGTVQFEVPDTAGDLLLTLSGRVGDDEIDNVYRSRVLQLQNPRG